LIPWQNRSRHIPIPPQSSRPGRQRAATFKHPQQDTVTPVLLEDPPVWAVPDGVLPHTQRTKMGVDEQNVEPAQVILQSSFAENYSGKWDNNSKGKVRYLPSSKCQACARSVPPCYPLPPPGGPFSLSLPQEEDRPQASRLIGVYLHIRLCAEYLTRFVRPGTPRTPPSHRLLLKNDRKRPCRRDSQLTPGRRGEHGESDLAWRWVREEWAAAVFRIWGGFGVGQWAGWGAHRARVSGGSIKPDRCIRKN
jgi:hypothetical protein